MFDGKQLCCRETIAVQFLVVEKSAEINFDSQHASTNPNHSSLVQETVQSMRATVNG